MDEDTNPTITTFDSCRMDLRELLAWGPAALLYGAISYLAMLLLF